MLPHVLSFPLDYGFSDPVDSDSDGITLICSVRISSFLHDNHCFSSLS